MDSIDRVLADFQQNALYIGPNKELYDEVNMALGSGYTLTHDKAIPGSWPEDLELVLIEGLASAEEVIIQLSELLPLAQGTPIFVLIDQRDSDFMLQAMRLGVRGFIEVPDDFPKILSLIQMEERHRMGKQGRMSVFYSLKGGVGCTVLAVNVAHHLALKTQERTVLVDLNMPLGDTSLYMDLDESRIYSVTDFVYNIDRFDDKLIYESLTQHRTGIYFLGLPAKMDDLDAITGQTIKSLFDRLKMSFDHIVVDCASDLSSVSLGCLDESDAVLLVTEQSLSSLRAVQAIYDLSQRLGYPASKLRMVINRYTEAAEELTGDLIDGLDLPVAAKIHNEYAAFLTSLNEGELLNEIAAGSRADKEMESIANMLFHDLAVAPVAIQQKNQGILKNLLSKLGGK